MPHRYDPQRITLHRDSLYIPAQIHRQHLQGRDTLALFRREERWCLLAIPQAGMGGLLAKMRNAQGDRVLHAQEVLRPYLPLNYPPLLCELHFCDDWQAWELRFDILRSSEDSLSQLPL